MEVNSHWLIFALIVLTRALVVSANFYEAKDALSIGQTLYYWTNLIVSILYPTFVTADFLAYDASKGGAQDPLIPVWFLFPLDLLWFACMFLTAAFLPRSAPIVVGYRLATEEEHDALENGEEPDTLDKLIATHGAVA